MHGWSLISGIINFLILAGVLYLFGRKLVGKMLSGRTERIVNDLNRSEEAKKNAAILRGTLGHADEQIRQQEEQIRAEATASARAESEKRGEDPWYHRSFGKKAQGTFRRSKTARCARPCDRS